MKKNFTHRNYFRNYLGSILTFSRVKFSVILFSAFLLLSCSKDEMEHLNLESKVPAEVKEQKYFYKGIFASQSSYTRGIIELNLTQNKEDLQEIISGTAILKLNSGEELIAEISESKSPGKSSEDFKVFFDSRDLQFNFYLDTNGDPVVADVIYKEQEGSIVVAEHTAASPVKPVTGVYRCTNCQDQTSSLNGIELNNENRIFNMLLTSKDGQTGISIQTVLGTMINAELVVEETCSQSGEYTLCTLKSAGNPATETVTWSGIHRFTTNPEAGNDCSTLWGNLSFNSPDNGVIDAEFISDEYCN